MFCFQCQQTAGNKGCMRVGVCGKQPDTANLQDELIYALIRLAKTGKRSKEADRIITDSLFTTLTNVNFDNSAIENMIRRAESECAALGGAPDPDIELFKGGNDIVSLRSTLLFGLKG